MDFLSDPIENINVAFCDIPSQHMERAMRGDDVRVSLDFQALHGDDVFFRDAPVCVAGSRPEAKPVEASLCCIICNEGRYLVEWLEYSRMMGFDHFYLYDHNSTDDTKAVLQPYIAAGLVSLHDWAFPGYPQREAHSHCTHRYGHLTRWLGLVDVDEFIVPVKSDSILPVLRAFDREPAVLRLTAAMFGTSGHQERPPGLVVASYTWRNVTTRWPHNPQHKVLFRPGEEPGLISSDLRVFLTVSLCHVL